MKRAIILLAIFGGIAWVATKAAANAKAAVETRRRQIEQQG